MRRHTRLGVAAMIAALVVVGAYSALWLVLAYRIEDGFVAWAQAARSNRIDINWQRIGVGGFPLALRVELGDARLADHALQPAPTLSATALWAAASPWNFRDWRFAAEKALTAELPGSEGRPPLTLSAARATGAVSTGPHGGARLWLTLHALEAAAGERLRAGLADFWLIVPDDPPRTDADPLLGVAVDLRAVESPAGARQLGDTIDRVSVALTAKGPSPGGPLRQAATAWRDAGGTIELDKLRLEWGAVAATATGTLALDQELQPEGALSGSVEGFDQLLGALVRSGAISAKNAGVARLALIVLAKTGPDGRPRITTSFTVQNGEMRLGPAKLGRAPHIDWPQ